ncbi:MAG: hypothetical protein PF961_04340 [Planctomycetota bacterium]|jgi:hypothetical protein|nr:hypothetical protein [Planctomycetota bacterium]
MLKNTLPLAVLVALLCGCGSSSDSNPSSDPGLGLNGTWTATNYRDTTSTFTATIVNSTFTVNHPTQGTLAGTLTRNGNHVVLNIPDTGDDGSSQVAFELVTENEGVGIESWIANGATSGDNSDMSGMHILRDGSTTTLPTLVSADLDGTWTFSVEGPDGASTRTLTISGTDITGDDTGTVYFSDNIAGLALDLDNPGDENGPLIAICLPSAGSIAGAGQYFESAVRQMVWVSAELAGPTATQ